MPISKIPGKGTQDLFNNISDEGTEGTKVATGTTAQRGSTTGQWRFNTSTGYFEGRNSAGSFSTLEPTPTIASVDVSEVDSQAGGNQTIVVTGTNFSSGGTISFVGNAGANFDASTTTYQSANQVTAVAPKASFLNAQEPYKVRFTSSTGAQGTSGSGLINVDTAPTWTTSAGSLGSVVEDATGNHFTVAATDADSDTIAYTLQSGSLAGLSLNSSTGVISGDPDDVSGDTTNSFTLRATAGSKTADRAFSYITKNLNTQALLFDATNMASNASGIPTANGQGLGSVSPSTAVTFSNVNGSTGTLAHGDMVANKADTWGHYTHNDGRVHHIGQTFWSIATNDPHQAGNATGAWFGTHNGGSYGNTDIWFTMDYGANPSFRITRMTGEATWRSGTGNFILYGTNDISNVGGNDGGSDAGSLNTTGLTQIFNVSNPGATWDSGVQTGDYYRYYVYRITASGSYDWGWDMSKWYGDYY